ncbi:MAG: hypothetical protein MUO36_00710 [Candidatus Hadarchaeum sp.]|nr:hypothetical protein [Candidatus Hadarchaeum sp.]
MMMDDLAEKLLILSIIFTAIGIAVYVFGSIATISIPSLVFGVIWAIVAFGWISFFLLLLFR